GRHSGVMKRTEGPRAIGLRRPNERDRFLGAGDDAKPAGVARIGARRVRRLPPVDDALQSPEKGEPSEIAVIDSPHLEHVIGADLDAITLALAAAAIDRRVPSARLGATLFTGAIRIFGRASSLL